MTNVENMVYRATVAAGDLDLANFTSVTNLTLDRTVGATDFAGIATSDSLTFLNSPAGMDTTVTYAGVTGAADAATVNLNGVVNSANSTDIAFAGAVETMTIATTGAASSVQDLDFDAGTTALVINADEALTVVNQLTMASVTSLTVTGDSVVTITPDLDDSTVTVNASAMTAGGLNVLVGNGAVTATGGAGDDRFAFSATEFTADDTVDGAGGNDTLAVGDAAVTTAGAAALITAIQAALNMETLELTTAAAGADTSVTLQASDVSTLDSFLFSTAITQAADADNARTAAIAITGTENTDSFAFAATVTGEAGTAAADEDGSDAITFAPLLDAGADAVAVALNGGVTITGGAAIDNGADDGETGGDGIDATTIETMNISSVGTAANAIAGGTGAGGTDGASVRVNTNGTINVTGTQDLNLGVIAGTNAEVDASTFTGRLTVTGEAGNNIIIGGSAVDTIDGGTGQDTFTGGGAADVFTFAGVNNGTGGIPADGVFDIITDFNTGGSDEIDFDAALTIETALAAAVAGTASINAEGIAAFHTSDDTLAERIAAVQAAIVAGTESDGDFAVFEFGADSYVFIEGNGGGLNAADNLIKLVGVTGLSNTTIDGSGDLTIA